MNLIYKLENFRFENKLKKIYFFKYSPHTLETLLINKINLNINHFNNKSLNKNLNIKVLKKIKRSGYFSNIEYIHLNNNKSEYFILHFKINPIIKKINVNNYKILLIPKSILINIFRGQLGLPINYADINKNINKILQWYKFKGYQWTRVHYSYSKRNNILDINIFEGRVIKSYCLCNESIVTIKQKYFIFYLNYLIKKELFILPGEILNMNNLELNISKLKKKYLINHLKYKIINNKNGLIITIKYNLLKYSKISIYHNPTILKILLNNVKVLRLYNSFTKCHGSIIQYFFHLYKYYYKYILYSRNKYELYYFNLFHLQYNQILFNLSVNIITNKTIIICFLIIKTSNNSSVINKTNSFSQVFFYHTYFYDYLFSGYKYFLNEYFYYENYSYLIKNFKCQIQLYLKRLDKIIIVQYFICKYYIYNKKICLIYFYKEILRPATHYQLKNILQKNNNIVIKYEISIKYNYFNLFTNYYFRIKQILNIYYSIYINLNTKKLYREHLFKYYSNNIEVNCHNLYQMPKIFNTCNKIKIITKFNFIIGSIKEQLNSPNYLIKKSTIYNLNNRLNTKLTLEYQIYLNKHNIFYLYSMYKSLNNLHFTYLHNDIYIHHYNNIYKPISLGMGLQMNTPIRYIPNIKIEVQAAIKEKYLISCYFQI
uniref:POTRA domain-containing protein n=1 Tax=Membranoptera platyphylla TaxID=1204437 RepID=A0A1I9KQV4_9FLOR|nr:hypothetical protein [Membranoptera platyphylla]AMJ16982.1 hypothetical protein [Membranoptera platyphylla]